MPKLTHGCGYLLLCVKGVIQNDFPIRVFSTLDAQLSWMSSLHKHLYSLHIISYKKSGLFVQVCVLFKLFHSNFFNFKKIIFIYLFQRAMPCHTMPWHAYSVIAHGFKWDILHICTIWIHCLKKETNGNERSFEIGQCWFDLYSN